MKITTSYKILKIFCLKSGCKYNLFLLFLTNKKNFF